MSKRVGTPACRPQLKFGILTKPNLKKIRAILNSFLILRITKQANVSAILRWLPSPQPILNTTTILINYFKF